MNEYRLKDEKSSAGWIAIVVLLIIVAVGIALYGILRPAKSIPPDTTSTQSPTTTVGGKKTVANYSDSIHGFSFDHVSDMVVSGPKSGDTWTRDWLTGTQTNGLLLAKGMIDRSAQPDTNFTGAVFTVGESNDPTAISSCIVAQNGESHTGTVTIGESVFHAFALGDAGAGNRYDTTSYRIIRNGRCFAVEYTIHSTNIGAYDPNQGIKEFDKASVMADLETSALSFQFLPQGDRDYTGTWTGVEGTSLMISRSAKSGTNYDLKFVTLDGPVSFKSALVGAGAFEFVRDGKKYTTFPGTGDDTGMKYLMGKKDCIVVAPYEGYCKN